MPSKPAGTYSNGNPAAKAGVVGLIALIIGLVAGYGFGRITLSGVSNPMTALTGKGGSYDEGYAAAMKKVRDSGFAPPAATQAQALSGTVKSVGTDSFVMTADLSTVDPLGELNLPTDRTVTVGANVKIIRQTPKSLDEQQKDQAAFQKALQGLKPTDKQPLPPVPYNEETISLSDIKVGDHVIASSDKDILKEQSFTATSVSVGTATTNALPMPVPEPNGTGTPALNSYTPPPTQPGTKGQGPITGNPTDAPTVGR